MPVVIKNPLYALKQQIKSITTMLRNNEWEDGQQGLDMDVQDLMLQIARLHDDLDALHTLLEAKTSQPVEN